MEETWRLDDGRLLSGRGWGDASGWPVFLLHGTPGSMRWTPGPDGLAHARKRGVQLITVSRPGYGRSDRLAGRRVVDWAVDADHVVESLGVGDAGLGVVGVSGGGPHALACGARTPHVRAVAVLAGGGDLASDTAYEGMAPASAALWRSAFEPDGALELLVGRVRQRMVEGDAANVAARLLAGFPASAVTLMEEHPALRDVMIEDLVEAFAGGGWGWLDDARAFASPWDSSSARCTPRSTCGTATPTSSFRPPGRTARRRPPQRDPDCPTRHRTHGPHRRRLQHRDRLAAGTPLTATPLIRRCVDL